MKSKTLIDHSNAWIRPDSYAGPDWNNYYYLAGRSRESDLVESTNFNYCLNAVEKFKGVERTEMDGDCDGEMTVEVVRDSHWAVGWVEHILIHKSACPALIAKCDNILSRLYDYPLLDEDAYSAAQDEQARAAWESFDSNDKRYALRLVEGAEGLTDEQLERMSFDDAMDLDDSGHFWECMTSN